MDFHVPYPDMYPHIWCEIYKVEPMEIKLNIYKFTKLVIPDALDWEDCPQPCTTFKLFEPATRPNTTTSFFIRYYIGHNMTWDGPNITIEVLDC